MLNNVGIGGLILITFVVLVLFGRGRVGSLIGEFGQGISSFRRGIRQGSAEDQRISDAHSLENNAGHAYERSG
jgi:sec-independent protein translocase protein TatA